MHAIPDQAHHAIRRTSTGDYSCTLSLFGHAFAQACDEQYAALLAHKVWVLVPLPAGRVAIRGHWVVAAMVDSVQLGHRYQESLGCRW